MKVLLLLVVSCLALHSSKGAPRKAVYTFVRCNPEGDQANCVTQQTPEMAWTPDLPSKLPASAAQYLEAEPVEGENDPWEEEDEYYDEGTPVTTEEGESPVQTEEGSGGYEGSAAEDSFMADWAVAPAATETGSGESWTEDKGEQKGEPSVLMRKMFPARRVVYDEKPAAEELREDHLLP